MKSEIGLKLPNRVLYNIIDDPINSWLHWDHSDPDDIRMIEKYVEDNGSTVYLPNCTVKILIRLWNYMDLLINQDKPVDQQGNRLYYVMDEQWTKLTAKDMRTALVNAKSEQRSSSRTSMPSFNTTPSSAPIRYPMNLELASFKKCIKREALAYSVLKDKHFFDKFHRDLLITAKSHDVSEILDSPEEWELFEAKQVFMYKVINETLQTDMGRTMVRKYLRTTDAQAVWKEYSDYMTTSSKGASEKRKLTYCVTNTVLDNQFTGTTQQFVLHLNEQFRRLDELTDLSERIPDSIKMALLQNAVKDIPQLSIVETMDEYTSTTSGDGSFTHLNYLSYYNLIIYACVRYDATNTSTPSKRRNLYADSGTQGFTVIEEPHETQFSQDIDTPSDDFIKYIKPNITKSLQNHYLGSSGIMPKRPTSLHPRSLLKTLMVLSMFLQKFTNSSALNLLLPSRNTILRPSTNFPRKGAYT